MKVSKKGDRLTLDFPAEQFKQIAIAGDTLQWFSAAPAEAYKERSEYMLAFRSEAEVSNIRVDMFTIGKLSDLSAVITTEKGDTVDFVSWFFPLNLGSWRTRSRARQIRPL